MPDHYFSITGCSYGNLQRANGTIFDYHAFSLIIAFSLCVLLIFDTNLRRVYAPLSRIVKLSLFLTLLSNFLYFINYPYKENHNDCSEIIVGRTLTACIIFGELHQVFFLANVLGLGSNVFVFFNFEWTLPSMMKTATVFLLLAFIPSIYIRMLFMINRNIWCFMVALMQIYFIRLSRKYYSDSREIGGVISSTDSGIMMFEKLSILQLIPCVFCMAIRIMALYNWDDFTKFEPTALTLDILCNLVFFLKVLLIKEHSNVKVEVIEE